MRIRITGESLIGPVAFGLLFGWHAFFIIGALSIAGWFVRPRWSRAKGWRFLH